jgi:UDP-2,3-diacylglucosamine pyrophosphatase LpxH
MVTVIEESSMIIAVADLHLGSQMANKSGFSNFINEYLEPNQDDISHIVLLGDILDLWRNTNSQVLLQNFDILTELAQLDMKKNYLAGNHDYAIFSLLSQSSSSLPPDSTGLLDQVSETLDLTSDGLKLRFIHGHQVDYWPALSFYEIFSQAMCFVDDEDQDLSDVWNIIHRFAESIPESLRSKVRNLPPETQSSLEEKLAGPLDGNMEGEKTGLFYEWELLQEVSDFEELAHRSSRPIDDIELFAAEWEQIIKTIDHYPESTMLPPHIAVDVHQRRREAAAITVGLQDDEFLIRGHGHTPYVNQETKVADAGCWLGTKGSYLIIEDGEVSVHEWKYKEKEELV